MKPPAQTDDPFARAEIQRRGTLVLQALVVIFIPLVITLFSVLLIFLIDPTPFEPPDPPAESRPFFGPLIPIALIAIFVSAVIVLVRIGRPTLSAISLITIWTLVTTISLLDGGLVSGAPALLVIPICLAGLLIDRLACWLLAAVATILMVSGVIFDPAIPLFVEILELEADASLITSFRIWLAGFWIGIFWTVAALTSILAGNLQQALQQSRSQAADLHALSTQLEERVSTQTAKLLDQERTNATMEERTRLAREIHDTLAQGLTGIVVQLAAARRAAERAPASLEDHIDLAERMAREALAEARRSVWNLRAEALERGSLGDALRGLAERSTAELPVQFQEHGQPYPLQPEVETTFLRVTQEGLANVRRHAEAQQMTIDLTYGETAVTLKIADDGRGFTPEVLANSRVVSPWSGFGLAGMRERLLALGGELRLENNGGAVVIAEVPLAAVLEEREV